MRYKFNDWMTQLDPQQVQSFYDKVNQMARREFGIDQDGDCPVEVSVLDRTRFEPVHTIPVRNSWQFDENTPQDEILGHLVSLECNAHLASEAMSTFVSLMRHWSNVRKDKARKPALNGARKEPK